jgi:hypothetical protein
MKTSIEMLQNFEAIKGLVTEAREILAKSNAEEFKQFNRAVRLSKKVADSVKMLKKEAWNIIKAENKGIEWKGFLEDLFSLTYSYVKRLERLDKISPSVISNYIEHCKSEGTLPNILGAIAFAENKDENKPKRFKPLTIAYKGKKASLSDAGNFTSTLTNDELKELISYLQSQVIA